MKNNIKANLETRGALFLNQHHLTQITDIHGLVVGYINKEYNNGLGFTGLDIINDMVRKPNSQLEKPKVVVEEYYDIGDNKFAKGKIDFCNFRVMLDEKIGGVRKVYVENSFSIIDDEILPDILPKTPYEYSLLKTLKEFFAVAKKV